MSGVHHSAELPAVYATGSPDAAYTRWAREHEYALRRPYPSAIYENVRSGVRWQVFDFDGERVALRRERKLHWGGSWFYFLHRVTVADLQDGRRWRYVGPTPEGDYLEGYAMADPQPFVTEPYIIAGSSRACN